MVYEYRCTTCLHEWEEEQKITENPVTRCPECAADTARRLISKTAFVLNGPGWFRDGY
jgi:putative FmdB family regulatory protein